VDTREQTLQRIGFCASQGCHQAGDELELPRENLFHQAVGRLGNFEKISRAGPSRSDAVLRNRGR
jgi:hypothetical protein